MKIRFLQSITAAEGWYYDANEIAEVPDERALQFIKTGHAEAVRDSGGDETAVLSQAARRK
jgi:hypothetical protein